MNIFLKYLFNYVIRISCLIAAVTVFSGVIHVSAAYADAADLSVMRAEMFVPTAQLNSNCSATLIYSAFSEKTDEVTTVFLTAKHCVKGDIRSDLYLDIPVYQLNRVVKKERYIAKVRNRYHLADLALIELKDKETVFLTTARIAPEKSLILMGEDVWVVGYPLGNGLTVTKGLFGSLETNDFPEPGSEYFRATPDIAGGNSGGAMYHLAGDHYELIGVTAAGMRGYPFIGLYTPIETIRAYLKTYLPEALVQSETLTAKAPGASPG